MADTGLQTFDGDGALSADWTVDNGDIQRVAGVAETQTASVINRARFTGTPMDTVDHEVEADVGGSGSTVANQGGIAVRMDSAGDTCYELVRASPSTDELHLRRVNGGSETILATYSDPNDGSAAVALKLRAEGTDPVTLTATIAGTDQTPYDDSDANRITTNTHAGMRGWTDTGRWDNFQAQDVASGPSISSVTSPVQPGDTLTIQGSNLDTVTAVTFAGLSVTMDSQTASAIDITVPDAYANGLAFQAQAVEVTDGANPDSMNTTLEPPADVAHNGAVNGYDALPSGQESVFDDSSIAVVDGDDYVVRDPSGLISTMYDDGTFEANAAGSVYVRVLDVSDGTDGPDGTWTEERTYTIQELNAWLTRVQLSTPGLSVPSWQRVVFQ